MLASVYDPTSIAGDAFDMDNMVEGTNNKLVSSAEKTAWNDKLDNITGESIADLSDVDSIAGITDGKVLKWSTDKFVIADDNDTTYSAIDFDIKDLTDSTNLKSTWSGKQDALGFTPENATNKKTSLADNSDTYYPSQKAVKSAVDAKQDTLVSGTSIKTINGNSILGSGNLDTPDTTYTASDFDIKDLTDSTSLRDTWSGKQDSLGFTPENSANKKTTITSSDTDYPTCKAVETALAGKQASGSYLTSANIEDSIVDGHTTIAPSGNAVYDALELKAPLASPTFTGTVTLADNARINLTLPTADTYVTGNVTASFNAGYSSSAGDLVFFGSGGKWLEVDADAVATCNGLLGIALEAKTDGQAMKVALPGSFVRYDAWNWTVGATLYAGETLGAIQETIPTGADNIIKVIGFAVNADTIYFYPSQDQQSTVA